MDEDEEPQPKKKEEKPDDQDTEQRVAHCPNCLVGIMTLGCCDNCGNGC